LAWRVSVIVDVGKQETQTYTPAEVKKMLTAARSDRLEPAWLLALSGLRRGEICGMRWSDIDLKGPEDHHPREQRGGRRPADKI
jgi:integrase